MQRAPEADCSAAPPRPARYAQAGHRVLYDAALLSEPPPPAWFGAAYWRERGLVSGQADGRGATLLLNWRDRAWVLKHYRRGGFAARLTADRYCWLGSERSRAFREWRLLDALRCEGLPVPRPVAAHCERLGASYRADLITERIREAEPLSAALGHGALPAERWRRIGALIRRLHAAGVCHADLNAHNVLLTPDAEYLVDFDRGRRRPPGRWQAANLARLERSLAKITRGAGVGFTDRDWAALLAGYGEP